MEPRMVGQYRLEALLGAGGMGVVYRAYDTRLERTVAMKFPPEDRPADEGAWPRLLSEARLASALNHPNICTIYEVGEAGGQVYIVMEHVDGPPLRALIPPGGLPAGVLLNYGMQIAAALVHAHQRGIIHRDLKSANIVITPEGCAKVLDFGLARRLRVEEINGETGSSVTTVNSVSGTLHYVSPQVLQGRPADGRGDLWALGVLLYEMAAGELPFHGATAFELTAAILRAEPRPLPAAMPAALRAIIHRCLEKDAGQRYQQASEVRAALEAVQSGNVAAAEPPPHSNIPRILVVEDEPSISIGLQADLEIEGYSVVTAADGDTALQRARQERFDLILLDVMLPRKDGFEVCRRLRRDGFKTPIILLTAMTQEAEKVMGLELGADDYITKPFSPRELRARVKVAVRRGLDARSATAC